MNKKKLLLIGVGVIVIILSAFVSVECTLETYVATEDNNNATVIIRSLITDKDVYHSNEEIKIVLTLYSSKNISDVLIDVSGLKNNRGKDLISFSKKTNLTSEKNEITFISRLPSCSPCAGISLGTYYINASAAYDDEVVNAMHSIAITPNPTQLTYVNISVEEAKRMLEADKDITLLDVRTKEEYNSRHINGATLIPVSELGNRTEELNKSKKIVVYCRSGRRSATASGILIEKEFEKVYNVLGGINAWEESGYPIISIPVQEQPGFEIVFAIAALLAIAYCMKRKRD